VCIFSKNISHAQPSPLRSIGFLFFPNPAERNNSVGPFPSALLLLPCLLGVHFQVNSLPGTLPEALYNYLPKLKLLDTYSNPITSGSISTRIGLLTDLVSLALPLNNHSETIPTEIGNLSKLQILSFGSNPRMTGTIPTEIFRLTNLVGLGLFEMSLDGTLSTLVGQLTDLEELLIYRNVRSSSIPTEIGNCAKTINL